MVGNFLKAMRKQEIKLMTINGQFLCLLSVDALILEASKTSPQEMG